MGEKGRVDWAGGLERACSFAPFLSGMEARYPEISTLLAAGDDAGAWALVEQAGDGASSVVQALRRKRGALALVTAVADLAGAWDFNRVTRTLSDFADEAVETALMAAFAERYPDEEPRGFAVIALGKHGSRELNYSSDIDPILIFDPQTLPRRAREEPVEAAVRLGRRMSEILSARDGDGYVFRVDLRLRPSPEATPIALPVEAAISYYESMALGWEQAAFIRSRICAGDRTLGEYFLNSIRPFVWRRSLDFGAIDAILDISRRIRDHYAGGQAFGPGYDLKRGRGGIREVEFFAQVHQLIHGGRQPDLRVGATRDALVALRDAGIISADVAGNLDEAYVLFRTIEHRLQMVDDRQTHELPAADAALSNVAHLHGLADGEALIATLRPHVTWVGRNYDQLAPEKEGAHLSTDTDGLIGQLTDMGFPDASVVAARITRWRAGDARALRSAGAREALEELLPVLFAGLASAPDPVAALNRLDDMIQRLPSAINFFKLLAARPALVTMLVEILSHAPVLADDLARRAELLDGLIDASALEPIPALDVLTRWLGRSEQGDDYQTVLDRVRQKIGERRFALGAQIVCGAVDPLEVGRGYGRLARGAVEVLAQATQREFANSHGTVSGGELVIVALGRLGGGALTHASDLDLIYLFTGDHETESDGRKPLGATQYFNRLAQRIGNALSVPTASGPLYEVDTRLRPFGAQGLIAASVTSFARYQQDNAWTWEHLALTRARPIFGSDAARAAVQQVIDTVLLEPRDAAELRRQAVEMRATISAHKQPAGPLDVKLAPGGLVDLEFLVQVMQLTGRTAFDPDLGGAVAGLIQAGLLPASLIGAYDLLTRYLIVSRLVSPGSTEPPEATQLLVAQRCGAKSWSELLDMLAEARQSIAQSWGAVVASVSDKED
ncbi:MAG: bifunctional [glutamine synthetase] adenylyltransferase/[glutamine synthetase]-adenylyl-L-tyrosine phosphorylase [Sphingobium sp.]|nr:bifunctional [glutamine synthetase] adenylyltransferase/[glutamine synthetase]-adenylyl-L-tyrosine phosphorylase [Sphingobium sp.]